MISAGQALFIAVCFFALGVLIRDVAQDHVDMKHDAEVNKVMGQAVATLENCMGRLP